MHNAWASLAKHKERRRAIEGIVGPLWDHFGGSKGIADAWIAAFDEATAVRRIRATEALISLMTWLQDNPDVLESPSNMTDEELDQEIFQASCGAMSSLLASEPELVAGVALQHGFLLVPPPESNNSPDL